MWQGRFVVKWRKYYWLDLPLLAKGQLKPGQALLRTHYFTSRIRNDGSNADDVRRQSTYIDALVAQGAHIHEGHYLEKQRRCRKCGATWADYEEKMTDVNIAVQLLADAFDDAFDTAFLISGDSDLTEPIARVRQRFPSKRVIVLFPPARHSKQLTKVANGYLSIGEDSLRNSQLSELITTSSGHPLHRPPHWK